MAGAIASILNDDDHRDALSRLAKSRAALFSWDESARALLACFDEIGHEPRKDPAIAKIRRNRQTPSFRA